VPRTWRGRLILLAVAAVVVPGAVALSGCGAAGTASGSPAASGSSAATASRAPAAARTDVPEPAKAPALTQPPAGTVVPMPGAPEGMAVDASGGILAVGVRDPDGVALVSTSTGRVQRLARLPGAPRHLQLAGPAGPVLVPAEQIGQLLQVAIPSGKVIADTQVGRQPHDAAAIGSTVFVGNEYSNTVSLVRAGKQVAVEPAPLQPGGVASNGKYIVVVGVRGRQIEAYAPDGRPLGTAPVGVGPTHVRAGPSGLFYVADTEGDAIIVFQVTPGGPRQVGAVPTEAGRPYGIAIDGRRGLVYVTLTATNRLESFRVSGDGLVPVRTWPTVRQPNDVAVDEATGRVFVAGRDNNQLELIDPGTPAG
jgi:sugar lactone lactonase YvrE